MNAIKVVAGLIENYKQAAPDYPESRALGAIESHFGILLNDVEDLLDAIDNGSDSAVCTKARLLRSYLNRLEQLSKSLA